jgi:hypothetical protein
MALATLDRTLAPDTVTVICLQNMTFISKAASCLLLHPPLLASIPCPTGSSVCKNQLEIVTTFAVVVPLAQVFVQAE